MLCYYNFGIIYNFGSVQKFRFNLLINNNKVRLKQFKQKSNVDNNSKANLLADTDITGLGRIT